MWNQDVDQDMSDSFASNRPISKDEPRNAVSMQPQTPNASGSSFTAIKPEPEGPKIAVVIKSELEHEPDLNAHVTFIKSEDGKFDIWNLEHLRLGPPVFVEKRFHVGFRRSVISNVTGSVDVVVSSKANEWVYFGSYETSRSGEITPHQLHLLPPLVVRTWVEGTLKSVWGRNWVEATNAELVDKGGEIHLIEHTTQGLREALSDGRLVIGFTVMKCVGYRAEWFDQFLHYQAHPKPPTTQKRKEGTSRAKKPSAKRVKGSTRQREVSSESDSDEDEFSDVEDKMKVHLGSASPGARKSSRLSAKLVGVRAENAELGGAKNTKNTGVIQT